MNIPNIISFSRIILSVILLFLMNSVTLFLILFFIAGITDVADGYIARKFKMVTALGARIDSVADIFFHIVLLLLLFLNYRWVFTENAALFVAILVIKFLSIIVSKMKFCKIIFLHTLANKLTGFLVFVAVPTVMLVENNSFLPALLYIALLTALEELLILIKEKEVNENRKSLFIK
ncbi:CDP-alcohol phosphatidyltransferase family protein [Bacteroides luti]|nr:CDP-alcohol phosphatidyltransferase family protein [Bacteroides luti]